MKTFTYKIKLAMNSGHAISETKEQGLLRIFEKIVAEINIDRENAQLQVTSFEKVA